MREPGPWPSVVVTADDFGFRDDWDRAIERAWREGIVTSVSVATTGATYATASAFLLAEGLDHGVHLDLLSGTPAAATSARGLVGRDGRFAGRVGRFLALHGLGQVAPSVIGHEWRAQITRAFDDGLRPTHLNAHYHLHHLPALLGLVVDLARAFDIPWIRLADEPPWHADRFGSALKNGALWGLAAWGKRKHPRGVAFVRSRGIAASGRLDGRALARILSRLGPGPTEIVVHPGQCAEEDAALTSAVVRQRVDAVARRRTFRDLEPGFA